MTDYRLSERLKAVRAQLAMIREDARRNQLEMLRVSGGRAFVVTVGAAIQELEMACVDLSAAESLLLTFEESRSAAVLNPGGTLWCGRLATEEDWARFVESVRASGRYSAAEDGEAATAGSGLDASGEGCDGKN